MVDSDYLYDIAFQAAVYELKTLKKAAYRLSDRCSFDFEVGDVNTICRLRFKQTDSEAFIQNTINDFRREVLDQDLRQIVADESAPLRNIILSHAFSKTGLQSQ